MKKLIIFFTVFISILIGRDNIEITKAETIYDYPNSVSVTINAKIFDERNINYVKVYKDTATGSTLLGSLFDDGKHFDAEALDSIYGGNFNIPLDNVEHQIMLIISVGSNPDSIYRIVAVNISSNNCNVFTDEKVSIANRRSIFSFDNKGVLADVSNLPAKFDGKNIMCSGGFYLSGYSDGTLWVNGVVSSNRMYDYIPGRMGENYGSKIYVVKIDDPPFGASWQEWSEAVEKGANFYDGNGDGIYNPQDLNGNNIWDDNEDAPEILGDVTAWCVYNDGLPASERRLTDVEPQGVEISQTVWTIRDNPNLEDAYFIRYSILNTGTVTQRFDSAYFALWNDFDIGQYTNDLGGCDTNLSASFAYQKGSDDEFYDVSPVAMVTILSKNKEINIGKNLASSYIETLFWTLDYPVETKEIVRNYMEGKTLNGAMATPCLSSVFGEMYGISCNDIDGRFMYSGEPFEPYGWVETIKSDKRGELNIGPFNLNAGETFEVVAAYHFTRDKNENSGSLYSAKEKAQYIIDNAENILSQKEPNDKPQNFVLYQNYPNPFSKGTGGNPITTINYTIPNSVEKNYDFSLQHVTLEIFDALGRKVATLVNARQPAGKYSVKFNGNGLASGVYFYSLQAGDFVKTKKMVLIK